MSKKIKIVCDKIINLKNLRIIIWGLGKTGTSILSFLVKNHFIFVCDKKFENETEKKTFELKNIQNIKNIFFIKENEINIFDEIFYDAIIISPGINVPEKIKFSEKFVCELDLFSQIWKGKIFAITGSIGKTSTTLILHQILSKHFKKKVFLGGNIGIPLFDLVNENTKNPIVIEASNLQLQYTKLFSPDYFIWTNIYKNHLDMHKNFLEYVKAKSKIFENNPKKIKCAIFEKKTITILKKLKIEIPKKSFTINSKIKIKNFPKISNPKNWQMISLLLSKIKININSLIKKIGNNNFLIPNHRIEWCGKIKNIDFFNDSKSTIMESTLCALKSLAKEKRPITLIFGGKPKGIDRTKYLKSLTIIPSKVIFFGEEKEIIFNYCKINNLNIEIKNNLEEAFNCAISQAKKNEIILFSPGGSSFDFFSSYEERGNYFKSLCEKLKNS